ncbi:hypothetical protein K439DRAFT_1645027 [Ramaria rubella]|nr:hypothetical protein K439DRAFT_1645027 [Ramaria rubella]
MSGIFLSLPVELHATRYLQECMHIPKSGGQRWLTLKCYKPKHPALFQSLLCVSPPTFDALLSKIKGHPVFQNNSDNKQIPVSHQLAIVLYHIQNVGLWAGLGYGTVDKLCDEGFQRVVMRWPSQGQKEQASDWVESQSCMGWHGGWLMFDGTLVPLFTHPGFYRNSPYDCKSNYSLNVQGVGVPGSQNDVTAWKSTCIPQEHGTLLGADEWVWADMVDLLQRWCQAPYKK